MGKAPDEPEDDEDGPDGAQHRKGQARPHNAHAGGDGEDEEGQAGSEVGCAAVGLEEERAEGGPSLVGRVEEAWPRCACACYAR